MNLIKQLESSGVDAILDLGFSKKVHRDKFYAFAKANNYQFKTHFLDVVQDIRWQRVSQRNQEKGATYEFDVTKEDFDFMETWFERPSDEEIIDATVIKK